MSYGMGLWQSELFHELGIHRTCYNASKVNVINTHFHSLLFHSTIYPIGFLATLFVPIYHFLIYPIFYNCIPTMLKRIGTGFFLLVSSFVLNSVIEMIGQAQLSNSTCMFDADHVPVPLDCSWTLIPELIGSIGIVLIFFSCSVLERLFSESLHLLAWGWMYYGSIYQLDNFPDVGSSSTASTHLWYLPSSFYLLLCPRSTNYARETTLFPITCLLWSTLRRTMN